MAIPYTSEPLLIGCETNLLVWPLVNIPNGAVKITRLLATREAMRVLIIFADGHRETRQVNVQGETLKIADWPMTIEQDEKV